MAFAMRYCYLVTRIASYEPTPTVEKFYCLSSVVLLFFILLAWARKCDEVQVEKKLIKRRNRRKVNKKKLVEIFVKGEANEVEKNYNSDSGNDDDNEIEVQTNKGEEPELQQEDETEDDVGEWFEVKKVKIFKNREEKTKVVVNSDMKVKKESQKNQESQRNQKKQMSQKNRKKEWNARDRSATRSFKGDSRKKWDQNQKVDSGRKKNDWRDKNRQSLDAEKQVRPKGRKTSPQKVSPKSHAKMQAHKSSYKENGKDRSGYSHQHHQPMVRSYADVAKSSKPGSKDINHPHQRPASLVRSYASVLKDGLH